VVDLAGYVALETSDDVGLGQAFLGPPFHIGAGAGVVAEPAENDHVEGPVGVAVAAAVESVSVGAAAAGGDRCGTTQVGEGGLGPDPVRVVAGAREELSGDFWSDARQGQQRWADLADELVEFLVGFGDLY
jgi:hypothetical protein